jgi:soluble lytic murein transglycosylase
MKALKRYRYHLVAILILIALLLAGARTKMSQGVTRSADELPHVGSHVQLSHALELFPEEQASLTIAAQGGLDMRQFILSIVKRSLNKEQRGKAWEIAHAVIAEANHHSMDPLFLLAVINTESKFNVKARGHHGEVGLMQLLPRTAKWLAPHAGLPSNFDLSEPSVNIRIGATYLSFLRHKFKRNGVHYLAAYNMGTANVRRLIKSKVEPRLYATRVLNSYEQIYSALNTVEDNRIPSLAAATRVPASTATRIIR